MGVNLKHIDLFHEVQPQCSECGVGLCWSIGDMEYFEWKGFWDDWCCRDCNINYKNAYKEYKENHKPFEWYYNKLFKV